MVKLSFFHLQVTKVKLEKIKLHLKLLTGKLKKKTIRYSRNSHSRFLNWNDILHNSEYLKRNKQA